MKEVVKNSMLFLMIFTLTGCYYSSFSLNEQQIRISNGKFDWDFKLSKIQITQRDDKGVPIEYSRDTVISLRYEGVKPLKTISFKEKNEGYYWQFFSIPDFDKYGACPIKFEKGAWYRISSLKKGSVADYEIFFRVLSNGDFESYDRHIKMSPF